MKSTEKIVAELAKNEISDTGLSIISTLLYFDIFNYPLNKSELQKFCHFSFNSETEFSASLNFLVSEKYIKHSQGFYFVNNDDRIIEKRTRGNILAEKFGLTAKKYSHFISRFPFVKAVFISGSLSKGYMDKDSDIDYFIVTKPGRLWLCRTLLVLYKKIFLLNSHKYFCVNYFIDEHHLEIPDKNIFTATELVTLKPMFNFSLFNLFLKSNEWVKDFLPNGSSYPNTTNDIIKKPKLKSFLEKIFNGSFGNKLDNYCLNITLNYWKKKFPYFNDEDFKNALRSRKEVSKHHPNKFQEKVLALYNEKIKLFENKYNLSLKNSNEVSNSLYQ